MQLAEFRDLTVKSAEELAAAAKKHKRKKKENKFAKKTKKVEVNKVGKTQSQILEECKSHWRETAEYCYGATAEQKATFLKMVDEKKATVGELSQEVLDTITPWVWFTIHVHCVEDAPDRQSGSSESEGEPVEMSSYNYSSWRVNAKKREANLTAENVTDMVTNQSVFIEITKGTYVLSKVTHVDDGREEWMLGKATADIPEQAKTQKRGLIHKVHVEWVIGIDSKTRQPLPANDLNGRFDPYITGEAGKNNPSILEADTIDRESIQLANIKFMSNKRYLSEGTRKLIGRLGIGFVWDKKNKRLNYQG